MKSIIICAFAICGFLNSFATSNRNLDHNFSFKKSTLDTTISSKIFKTKGYEASITQISLDRIETYMDSGYYPKSLYYNIRFAEILGTTITEVNKGKLSVELFNEKNEKIALVKDPRMYVAKTFKVGEQINILFSIPLNPTDINNKKYNYNLSIETLTNTRIIEMKGKIGFK